MAKEWWETNAGMIGLAVFGVLGTKAILDMRREGAARKAGAPVPAPPMPQPQEMAPKYAMESTPGYLPAMYAPSGVVTPSMAKTLPVAPEAPAELPYMAPVAKAAAAPAPEKAMTEPDYVNFVMKGDQKQCPSGYEPSGVDCTTWDKWSQVGGIWQTIGRTEGVCRRAIIKKYECRKPGLPSRRRT